MDRIVHDDERVVAIHVLGELDELFLFHVGNGFKEVAELCTIQP